ncbi:serine protease inhibitor 88Ea [Calliopsis andreniformis]|uniref:serine protease inhibitor 88Ea n=1 Tax=Calliopsis andreniformis TaxID=337506 RepID=UPI003FCE925A
MLLKMAMSALSVLFLLSSVSAQCLTANDSPGMMNPASKKALTDARFAFALDSLKKAALIETKDNIFYSPHSLHEALVLAYFGSRGTTEQKLKKSLHIPNDLSKIDLQRFYAFENVLKFTDNVTDYEYRSANRLWITDKKKLRECMLDFFGEQLEKTDFQTNPEAVRQRINNWVSNMTKGHIHDLIGPDSIDANTDLVLANAVYFKGLWKSRFDPANSKRDLFYSSGSQNSMVTFMRQKGNFNHLISEMLGAHILELPYKGDKISMYILLPPFASARSAGGVDQDSDQLRRLIERISTDEGSTELREILDFGVPPREVDVFLPKFTMERDLPLAALLSAMGAGELMTPSAADLRGFLQDGERSLHLGDGIHRARIEVTEEGTTAAGATALFSFRSGRPLQPAEFKANHPFVFFIYDRSMHTVLFSGIYRVPDSQQSNV